MDPYNNFNPNINPQYNSQPPLQNDSQTFTHQSMNSQFQPFSQFAYNPFVFAGSSQIPMQQQMHTPNTSDKKSSGGRTQRDRQPNWSVKEDEALCRAWLHISEDPTVGTNQRRGKLWDRIGAEFVKILKEDSGRPSGGLMNRWSTIQLSVTNFSGYVNMIERAPISGQSAEDNMLTTKQLYYKKENHVFKWETCWLILKDTPKWYNHINDVQEKKKRMSQKKRAEINLDEDDIGDSSNAETPSSEQSTPSGTPTSISLDDEDGVSNNASTGLPRPPGNKCAKSAKKKKKINSMDLFAEEFSNMRKEASSRFQEEGNRKHAIEQQKLQAKMEARNLQLQAQKETEQMRIAAMKEQEQKRFEKEIMMMDPNSAPTEEGKIWIIEQQAWIMEQQREIISRARKNKSAFTGPNN
ncbi:hypothetical protein ACP275_11G092200 [Erythranthe tilingii]